MHRRKFLKRGGTAFLGGFLTSHCRKSGSSWRQLRLVAGQRATEVERTVLEDVAAVCGRAIGVDVPVVTEGVPWGPVDLLMGCPASLITDLPPPPAFPGAFNISTYELGNGPRVIISGADPEGARNGLYAFLEKLGFGFFRDGETFPELGKAPLVVDSRFSGETRPAFRWRGDMIWDNYLGPRRYCAAVWGEVEWERALLYLARKGLNFLEFYPPLERIWQRAFPDARGLSEGPVWKASEKHALARKVLQRGRSLGIHFMYVLNYGFFPQAIRALYPELEWRNGFLCAHQPELAEMTERTWRHLLDELGTDHLYALRHRGEENQSYSDPCRSVTKADGYAQAISVMNTLDPKATVTVWTWGETLPDLFSKLPSDTRAVHIRHGMANVFGDRGEGREQADGAPRLPSDRRWLSGQFTVFSGNETLVQTAWSSAETLTRDARASSRDASCEGYFQWPEWSNTSPWLSEVVARLAWNPASLEPWESAFGSYAKSRHGDRAEAFLAGFMPLMQAGNARFMNPPRKRLLVPYYLAHQPMTELQQVREGARTMVEQGYRERGSSSFDRDLVDLMTWIGLRQAQVFEAEGYGLHLGGDQKRALELLDLAENCWQALHGLLAGIPELSILEAARSVGRAAPVSGRVVESFWTQACDFYNGYPLVLSPEAIELVYQAQLENLRSEIEEAAERGEAARLKAPGWFWHDFPDPAWADAVRMLPRENALVFEETMKARLSETFRQAVPESGGEVTPPTPSPLDYHVASESIAQILSMDLPAPRPDPPLDIPAPLEA